MVTYGRDIGYTILLTVCVFQNFAYTMINVGMLFGKDAYEFAREREMTKSKRTKLLTNTMFHVKFIRLYFFNLWLLNTASTYMLFYAFDVAALPVAVVFVVVHLGVLAIDWNPREVPIHTILGGGFLVGGILAIHYRI